MNIESDIRKGITKYDILLVVFLLVLCATLFACSLLGNSEKRKVEISVDGEIVHTAKLEELEESYSYIANGCEIYIGKDGARFISSPCEDGLCVKFGMLSENSDTMACVPQRVVITVKNDKDSEFDAVAY